MEEEESAQVRPLASSKLLAVLASPCWSPPPEAFPRIYPMNTGHGSVLLAAGSGASGHGQGLGEGEGRGGGEGVIAGEITDANRRNERHYGGKESSE